MKKEFIVESGKNKFEVTLFYDEKGNLKNNALIDGELYEFDLDSVKNPRHLILNGKSFNVSFESLQEEQMVFVEGDKFLMTVYKKGEKRKKKSVSKIIKSPLSGQVVKVLVKAGDKVNKGEVLLVLEAMKMENEIKSPENLVVRSVNVKPGDVVEGGFVLVEFE